MLTHTGITRYYTLKYTNKKNEIIEANIEMGSSYFPSRDEWQKAVMITIKLPEQGKEEDIQMEQGGKNWFEYEEEALSQFLEEVQ